MTQILFVFLILFSFSARAEKVEPKPGDRCFKFTLLSNIDDKKCLPVKTKIEFFDCKTQAAQEVVDDVSAKFECKRNPKRLKYWHKDTMLFANVEKKNGAYEVTQTSSLVYSTKDPSTPVVAPPSSVKEVADVGNLHPVAFVPSGLPQPAPSPSPTPEAMPQAAVVVPPPTPIKEALPPPLNDLKIYGLVDAYYLYNMNLPPPASPSAVFPTTAPNENVIFLTKMYHDQFTANMAMLGVSKRAEPVGFKLELAYGPQAARFLEISNNTLFALSQAVLVYKTPFDLTIELGKFHSLTGLENLYASENMLYTLSFGKQWVLPAWHQGIKMTMPFLNDSFLLSFYVVNGSNIMYETNASKSFGGQLKFAPSESVELVANMVGGNETAVGGADIRSTIEGIAAFKPWSGAKIAVDFSTSQESLSGNTPSRNSSLAVYLGYQITGPWSLAARYETYSDDAVYASGLRSYTISTAVPASAVTINSITGTLEFAATKDLKFKAEYRTDTSSLNSYTDNLGNPVGIQNLGVIAGVLSF